MCEKGNVYKRRVSYNIIKKDGKTNIGRAFIGINYGIPRRRLYHKTNGVQIKRSI